MTETTFHAMVIGQRHTIELATRLEFINFKWALNRTRL